MWQNMPWPQGFLKEALNGVVNGGGKYSPALREEAGGLLNRIDALDTMVFTPAGAKDALVKEFKRGRE